MVTLRAPSILQLELPRWLNEDPAPFHRRRRRHRCDCDTRYWPTRTLRTRGRAPLAARAPTTRSRASSSGRRPRCASLPPRSASSGLPPSSAHPTPPGRFRWSGRTSTRCCRAGRGSPPSRRSRPAWSPPRSGAWDLRLSVLATRSSTCRTTWRRQGCCNSRGRGIRGSREAHWLAPPPSAVAATGRLAPPPSLRAIVDTYSRKHKAETQKHNRKNDRTME